MEIPPATPENIHPYYLWIDLNRISILIWDIRQMQENPYKSYSFIICFSLKMASEVYSCFKALSERSISGQDTIKQKINSNYRQNEGAFSENNLFYFLVGNLFQSIIYPFLGSTVENKTKLAPVSQLDE
ncbi:hypothetical protein YC2023_000140 [Brassica napus]